MNRRDPRVQTRTMRRVGVVVASFAMVGAMAGFSGTASASFNGRCSRFDQTCQTNGGASGGFTRHTVDSPAPGDIGFCTFPHSGLSSCF